MLKTVHFDFENCILCYRCTSFWYNILHVNVTLKAMQFELNRELKQYVYNDNNWYKVEANDGIILSEEYQQLKFDTPVENG